MNNNILKAFSIEPDEAQGVLLLILQSVFIGIFYGAFEIAANALFLDYFEPSMLTKAYAASGLVGIVMTSMFTKLQEKIKFSSLAIINILFIAILTAVLRFCFGVIEAKWVAFALLVVYGPFRIIALVGFWGSVGRLFTLRQGKRLFGLIDTGWIIGIILSSYLIPVLLRYSLSTQDVLVISATSIVLAAVFQSILGRKFNLNQVEQSENDEVQEKKLLELMKNPYILAMSIFVILSMVTAFFIQYSFISVTKDQYPDSTQFAMFLGFFIGTMMIFILLIKTFVYSKLMKTYGLKVALIISPALLIFFTVLAAIVGSFFGYTSASATFTFFFLLVALSKLFATALKDAIELPSFKILYQSIDKAIRYDVQAKVDGTVNEIAALFSGILLALLGLLPFFKSLHFSYCLVIILAIWFIYASKLFIQYQNSLQKSLQKKKDSSTVDQEKIEHVELIKSKLSKESLENKVLLYKTLELIDPLEYEELLLEDIAKDNGNRAFCTSEIDRLKILTNNNIFDKIEKSKKDKVINEHLSSIRKYYDESKVSKISKDNIDVFTYSSRAEERIKACKLIRIVKDKKYLSNINMLLRDYDKNVKIEAIKAASYIYNSEILTLLIDLLEDKKYSSYISSSLRKIGDDAVDSLDQAFYKTDIEINTLIQIVNILNSIGNKKANESLIKQLDHINRDVQYQAIVALNQSNYKPDETSSLHIHEAIENLIGIISWNIAAQLSLEEGKIQSYINDAFEDELDANFKKLFLLLSIIYDKRSIENVKENLESGTSEGIGFGIELLDQFVADELKNILFPILEDSSKMDKIKQMQNHYPVDKTTVKELCYDIINRDINQINYWTKACALFELSKMEDIEIENTLIAQLFNPDNMLRELSARIIYENDLDTFNRCIQRVEEDIPEKNIENLDSSTKMSNSIFESILTIKKNKKIESLPGNTVYKIIKNSKLYEFDDGQTIKINTNNGLIHILNGTIKIQDNQKVLKEYDTSGQLNLFKYANLGNSLSLEVTKGTKFYSAEKNELYNLLYEDQKLLNLFISSE